MWEKIVKYTFPMFYAQIKHMISTSMSVCKVLSNYETYQMLLTSFKCWHPSIKLMCCFSRLLTLTSLGLTAYDVAGIQV